MCPLALAAAEGPSPDHTVAYVAALTEDSILRLVDLNGDGDRNDAGESAVFFGPGNAEGFPGVGSVQALLASGPDELLAADGEEAGAFFTAVYRLKDFNGDGDAMDAGESTVYWDATLPLPGSPNFDRPKAILRQLSGAFLLADNNTINFDNDAPEAIWQFWDTNSDGAIDPAGEVSLFVELSPMGSAFGFVTEDYAVTGDGRITFTNLNSSSNTINLWSVSTAGGPPVAIGSTDDVPGIAWKEQGLAVSPFTGRAMVAATDIPGNSGLIELADLNGDGDLGDAGELVARYVSSSSAEGIEWNFNNVIDLETAPDGSVWLTELGGDRLIRFEDVDGDSNFQGPGEAVVTYDPALAAGETTAFPRRLTFATARPGCNAADLAAPFGTLNVDDVLRYLDAVASGDPEADTAPPIVVVSIDDVLAFLDAFALGCP